MFESERLYFRLFTLADGPQLVKLHNDPLVTRFIHEQVLTPSNVPDFIRNFLLPDYELNVGRWAVHVKMNKEFIGWAGLRYTGDRDETDLGFRFFPGHWNKGYATEAASRCIKYGFEELSLENILARAHVENTASQRVLQKSGMKFLRNEFFEGVPVYTYGLVRKPS